MVILKSGMEVPLFYKNGDYVLSIVNTNREENIYGKDEETVI